MSGNKVVDELKSQLAVMITETEKNNTESMTRFETLETQISQQRDNLSRLTVLIEHHLIEHVY